MAEGQTYTTNTPSRQTNNPPGIDRPIETTNDHRGPHNRNTSPHPRGRLRRHRAKYLAWSAPRPTTTRAGYVEQLLTLLVPGASVLGLGCGAGVPTTRTIAAQEKRLRVTGVDISAAQVALAREHVKAPGGEGEEDKGKIAFVHADMMKLEYPERSFDAVLAFYSIFHLPQEEQAPMVGRMVGWLKPGGYLLLNMRTEEGDFLSEDWTGARMFSSGIGVKGNRRAFKECGKGLTILVDEIATEMVGGFEEKSHWVFARKE